jgi:hypothetical protein
MAAMAQGAIKQFAFAVASYVAITQHAIKQHSFAVCMLACSCTPYY